jgi:uncharacterized protein (DUF302 family)
MTYGSSVTMVSSFEATVAAVRQGLATQGFGVLTEIDVRATMKAKLGADLEPYVILGACNPALALRALTLDPSLGLLLPCNVVVRRTGEVTVVEAVDPTIMAAMSGDPALAAVARVAAERLATVLAGLGAPTS